jgi:hypothetical protein
MRCDKYRFAITCILKKRIDAKEWAYTIVYGPTDSTLKVSFWSELNQGSGTGMWIISGDFHANRARKAKSGTNFNAIVSNKLNALFQDLSLKEY